MATSRPAPLLALAALCAAVVLSACGGGGGGSSGGDVFPGSRGGVTPTSGPDSFLLFPNPQKQDDGTLEVAATAYATAYYEAIDPNGDRDTLAKFKAKNNFGTAGGALGEVSVIVGDQRDLGYGRKMTARQNADGTLAFVVENYLVGAYGAYSPFNLEAAIASEAKWHLGTNAIEFSPGPGGTINFVKFYTYDPVTGARLMVGNLDGRGSKAMPTICVSCHGGRGDPLTPPDPATGKRLFPKLMNSVSLARGDVGAQLHPFETASLDFSTTNSSFTRASLESNIKTINKMVLCSMPLAAATGFPEDACRITAARPVATVNEYQGTAVAHLKDMYGGDGLPNATSNTTDTYLPAGWAAESSLYSNTQAQACRVCHLLRGTGNQSDIDFATFAKFDGYSERIKAHVLDRGNMPLAKLIYDKYWSTPSIYNTMATYLTGKGYTNTAVQPGKPVADPGPSRVVKAAAVPLSAAMSLFSSTYQWSIVTDPVGGATLSNATSSSATLNTAGNGTYVVRLVTGNGTTTSAAVDVTIVVDSALAYNPTALRFSDIKTILQAGGGGCTTCHQAGGNGTVTPPIWYTDYDRDASGGYTAADDHWFYTELRGRINFSDIAASALLRKPAGHHHNGLQRTGFDDSQTPGNAARVDYDKILGWILNGAPE